MAAEVVCMSLGTVPPGEQRSRFLAVGLADQTVRIISLDPSVSDWTCSVSALNSLWGLHRTPFNHLACKLCLLHLRAFAS